MVAAFEQSFCYYFGDGGRTCWVWWRGHAWISGANLTNQRVIWHWQCDGCGALVLMEMWQQMQVLIWEGLLVEFFFRGEAITFFVESAHVMGFLVPQWHFRSGAPCHWVVEITIEMDLGGPNYHLQLWFCSDRSITKSGMGRWERGDERLEVRRQLVQFGYPK